MFDFCLRYAIIIIWWSCDIVFVARVYCKEYKEMFFHLFFISNIGYYKKNLTQNLKLQ